MSVFGKLVDVLRNGQFDPSKGSFHSYLATMVYNEVHMQHRKDEVRKADSHVPLDETLVESLAAPGSGEVEADCYLIGVEKSEPMRCGVWKLTDGLLQACACENERAIAELRECRRENSWPTRTEDLRILDI